MTDPTLTTNLTSNLLCSLEKHTNLIVNADRKILIKETVDNREAIVAKCGALASWTSSDSTGRSPKDTVIVKRPISAHNIDWLSSNNIPIDEDTFDMAFNDAIELLKTKEKVYVTDRVIGADAKYALPVKTITDNALTAVFTDNMFRPVPENINESVFYEKDFTLITLPYDKLDSEKYQGKLRKLVDGSTSGMLIAMDYDSRLGIVIGSSYLGSVKKLMFTTIDYYLPFL